MSDEELLYETDDGRVMLHGKSAPTEAAPRTMIERAVIPQQSEADFLGAVQDLADTYGWLWLHIDPALNDRGYWRTPIRGSLGKGWPDLFLIHPERGRMVYAELKSEKGRLKLAQEQVLGWLGTFGFVETYVWKPSQWQEIVQCLAR